MGAPPPRPRPAPGRGAPIAGERSPRTRNFSSLRKKSCAPLRVILFFPPSFLVSPSPFFLLKVSFLPLYPSLPLDRMADSTSVSINFFFPPPLLHLNKFKAPPPTPQLTKSYKLGFARRSPGVRKARGAGSRRVGLQTGEPEAAPSPHRDLHDTPQTIPCPVRTPTMTTTLVSATIFDLSEVLCKVK